MNSNTTLVKVKYHSFKNRNKIFSYSNTTLVKVKWGAFNGSVFPYNAFKYNSCYKVKCSYNK